MSRVVHIIDQVLWYRRIFPRLLDLLLDNRSIPHCFPMNSISDSGSAEFLIQAREWDEQMGSYSSEILTQDQLTDRSHGRFTTDSDNICRRISNRDTLFMITRRCSVHLLLCFRRQLHPFIFCDLMINLTFKLGFENHRSLILIR